MTQVFREEVTQPVKLAVWVGPGHVQDFSAGIPNCMVVDSDDPAVTESIVEGLSSDLIRLYKGGDLIGTEVGAAAKNVIGIAAGMLDGCRLYQPERRSHGPWRAGNRPPDPCHGRQ